MNKEIKFRAFNKQIHKMTYWDEIKQRRNLHKLMSLSFVELMQYTGLKDKNGVEIYEGDIVVDLRHPNENLRVAMDWYWTDNDGRYEEHVYGWVAIELDGIHHASPLDTKENEYEIIGNIHEKEVQDEN